MTDSDSTQRNYAAIGRVCAHWSDVEWFCQRISEVTAPFLAVDLGRKDASLVLTVALAHMDIRNKIATAKVFVERAGISRSLRRDVIRVLNRIDNEHRLERNRFIHDEWIVSKRQGRKNNAETENR